MATPLFKNNNFSFLKPLRGKILFALLFFTLFNFQNSFSQAITHNHDINLGPDIPFCDTATYTFNPFIADTTMGLSCNYLKSNIPYTPENYNTGTLLSGLTDDCFSNNLPIGFRFDYFCASFNYFRLSTNAILCLTNPPQNANSTNFPQGSGCSGNVSGCEGTYSWNTSASGSLGQANNQLPVNSIFFGGMDLLPTAGGQIRYQVTGTAPYRKFTMKFKDVAYFSCTSQLYNAQVMLYETTNIVEIHVLKKQTCAWNGNLGIYGLQGQFTNQFSFNAGYNNQSFQFTTAKAWRFSPAGTIPPPANLPITIKWKKLPNGPITYGQSISIVPQVGQTTCYTALIVRNNATHSPLGCGSNSTPDTVCFYPSFITANTVNDSVLCNGTCTAIATTTATYGVPPWSFNINSLTTSYADSVINVPNLSNSFGNLCAGDYVVKTTDSLHCTIIDTITIIQPDSIQYTVQKTNILCNGNSTGSLIIDSISGGVPPYSYSINGTTFQTTPSFSGLIAGNYTITVKDANNCIKTKIVTLNQPLSLNIQSLQVNVDCFGNNTGSITLTATGGTTNYTFYCGGNSNNTGIFGALIANAYSCSVQDFNGCVSTATVTVTQPSAVLGGSITSQTNVSCNGGSNGILVILGNGGTSPYQYTIPSGTNAGSIAALVGNVATFSNLFADVSDVLITDNHGCLHTVSVSILQPNILSYLTDSNISVDCFGNATGQICIQGSGGVSPYDFTCTGIGYNSTVNNLLNTCFGGFLTGNYNIVVTDANNCTAQQGFFVSEPVLALSFGVTSVDSVSCHNGSDGSVDLLASGGTTPYTYNISPFTNFQSTLPLTGINAGTHLVTVRDDNGCIDTTTVILSAPILDLAFMIDSTKNVSCNLGNNGCIYTHAIIGTGTPPYSFSTSSAGPFVANDDICGLASSTYTVYMQDVNNCIATINVNITQPQPLFALVDADSVTCNGGSDACVHLITQGGTSPYSIYWLISLVPQDDTLCGLSASAGNHFKVIDSLGCFYENTFTILEPNPLIVSMVDTINLCTNDPIMLATSTIGGTPGYNFLWNPTQLNADTVFVTPPNNGMNIYSVTVTDAHGCSSNTDSVKVIVRPTPIPIITSTDTNGCVPFCSKMYDNSYVPNTFGDYLVYHSWSFGDGYSANQLQTNHCYESEGNYTVCLTVESNQGCKKKQCIENYVKVNPLPENDFYPDPPTTDLLKPTVSFIYNKIDNGSYFWDFGDGVKMNSGNDEELVKHQFADTGTFEVILTTQSEFGCLDSTFQTIIIDPFFTLYAPTAFTPNGDAKNARFIVYGLSVNKFEMSIFNRFGEVVHSQHSMDENVSWDGADAPEGVYSYVITTTNTRGKNVEKNGSFSLIR